MKSSANILMFRPETSEGRRDDETTDPVLSLAGCLAADAWVYLGERGREKTEDLPCGVRLLGWSDTIIEHFECLDLLVAIDDPATAGRLSRRFPELPIIHWDVHETGEAWLEQLDCRNRSTPWLSVMERILFRTSLVPSRLSETQEESSRLPLWTGSGRREAAEWSEELPTAGLEPARELPPSGF